MTNAPKPTVNIPTHHYATLQEVHVVQSVFPATEPAHRVILSGQECRKAQYEIAQRWADAHGLEIDVDTDSYDMEDGRCVIETRWIVTVGKGDIDQDQLTPGHLDRWCWSARVGHWRRFLQGLGREGRRLAVREDGMAKVHQLRPTVYNFPDVPEGSDLVSTPNAREAAEGVISLDREFTEDEIRTSPYTGLFSEDDFPERHGTPRDGRVTVDAFAEATRRFIEPTRPYLPGTGPVEHRPAWLQNDSVAGEVGGEWSNT